MTDKLVPDWLGTSSVLDAPSSGNATSTQVVLGNDSRLSDARTPTSHAASHASAGSDPVTPASIGAATSAQGTKADTAVQPGALAAVATSGAYADLTGTPSQSGVIVSSVVTTGGWIVNTDSGSGLNVWKSIPNLTVSFVMPSGGVTVASSLIASSTTGGSVPASGAVGGQLQWSTDGTTWTKCSLGPSRASDAPSTWSPGGSMGPMDGVITTASVAAGTPVQVRVAFIVTTGSQTYKSWTVPGSADPLYMPSYVRVSAL